MNTRVTAQRELQQTHFNVEPEEAKVDLVGVNIALQLGDLSSRIAALDAREKVQIDVFETGVPGLLHAVGTGLVDNAKAAVAPNNGKLCLLAKAVPVRLRIGIRNVDAQSVVAGIHAQRCNGQQNKN